MKETQRRRKVQERFNTERGIVPRTVRKAIRRGIDDAVRSQKILRELVHEEEGEFGRRERLAELEREMMDAAEKLDFERAAEVRDRIHALRAGDDPAAAEAPPRRPRKVGPRRRR